MRQRVRLFLSCRDTAIIASPQTTEGFDAKHSVGAGDVRRDWGGLLVRLCRVGDHSGAGAYSPKGRLWRTGPALPMGNGLRPRWLLVRSLRRPLLVASLALLAASSAVLRCRAEGLIVATASASAGAHFRLRMTWEN